MSTRPVRVSLATARKPGVPGGGLRWLGVGAWASARRARALCLPLRCLWHPLLVTPSVAWCLAVGCMLLIAGCMHGLWDPPPTRALADNTAFAGVGQPPMAGPGGAIGECALVRIMPRMWECPCNTACRAAKAEHKTMLFIRGLARRACTDELWLMQCSPPPHPNTEPAEHNTTLFIGGLAPNVSESELHAAFARFGEIAYTKIPANKGCGFVQVGPVRWEVRWGAGALRSRGALRA